MPTDNHSNNHLNNHSSNLSNNVNKNKEQQLNTPKNIPQSSKISLNKARNVFINKPKKNKDNNQYSKYPYNYKNNINDDNINDEENNYYNTDDDTEPEKRDLSEDLSYDTKDNNDKNNDNNANDDDIYNSSDDKGKNKRKNSNSTEKNKNKNDNTGNLKNNNNKPLNKNKTNPLQKGGLSETGMGGKSLEDNAYKGAKKVSEGAQKVSEGVKKGTESAAKSVGNIATATGSGAAAGITGGCLSILLPILAIFIAVVMALSAIICALCGYNESDLDAVTTPEAQQIMYVFNSFVHSSNDKDKDSYKTKLDGIKTNGYSSSLCAMWKGLVMEYYIFHQAEAYENTYDESAYDSAFDAAYYDYCARYYLEKDDDEYKQKNFEDFGLKPNDYVGKSDNHYHYINNIIKMCIDSFTDTETGKTLEPPLYILSDYKSKNADKVKGLEKDEILEMCREEQIGKAVKNLEGKKGLANTCITYESKTEKIPFIAYLYTTNDTDRKKLYNDTKYTLSKKLYNVIYNYDYSFRNGGYSDNICELALGEIGKMGKDYCNGQTKVWNGGLTQWCAIFQAYLLEQTGIDPEEVGWSASCSSWISNADKKGLYHSKSSGYKPAAGDILFFEWGHVGLVYSVSSNGDMETIEGNTGTYDKSTSKVEKHTCYTTKSSEILGYISMSSFYNSTNGNVSTKVTDATYKGHKIKLTQSERKKIEILVTNENAVNGYTGCMLLAQCMRDAIYTGNAKASTIKKDMGYTASDTKGTACNDAKRAVKKIFDEGGYAVKHRILYMYNPGICKSTWHESQLFVCEHGKGTNKIRYFDKK